MIVGEEVGGSVGYLLAMQNRELIRGVAAINAALPPGMNTPENEPVERLAFFTTIAKQMPPAILPPALNGCATPSFQ